jgi:hypothetical protein
MVGAIATVLVGWLLHLGIWPLVALMILLAVAALAAGMAANTLERRKAI